MGMILQQMSENGKAKVKNEGFYKAAGGFRGGKPHGWGRGRILENRYSFLFWTLILEDAELREENYLSWREGKW
jgi:hypothetical protein